MKLEDQVCSLEYAKRLKELGVNQESVFYWYQPYGEEWLLHYIDYNHHETDRKIFLERNIESISAFTVSELGQLIKDPINKIIFKMPNIENYDLTFLDDKNYIIEDKYENNEANCRAKILIYFLENKFMELPNDK